jgi:hypothetical protein
MRKRTALATTVAVLAAAGGGTAVAGGSGLILDDGHYVRPGTLDDGQELLPQTRISTADAVARAQAAASGEPGQVDVDQSGGRVVYVVDVGGSEVSVDAVDGSVTAVAPQS